MTILFHYSDVDGFFNIVKNKKLWLSGPHNLNDHKELHWAMGKTYEALQMLSPQYQKEHVELLWENIRINRLTPFTCSLSSNGDLLSQWRAYARNGTGLAIGLNKDLLPHTGYKPHHNAAKSHCITTMQVVYDDQEQNATIKAILEKALTSARDSENWQTNPAMIDAALEINGLSTIYKNNAFREECEWRLIHTPMITGNTETNKTSVMGGLSEIKHRTSNGKLITFFEYDFSHLVEAGFITDLVLGPKCEITEYDLKIFLSVQGMKKLNFRRSAASYR